MTTTTKQRLRSQRRASIVHSIIRPSDTGHMPPPEAHLHADYLVVLLNRLRVAGCFTDFIVRNTFDKKLINRYEKVWNVLTMVGIALLATYVSPTVTYRVEWVVRMW
jgi:hypothetical protein